jgi:cytochrome c oxidase assembly protein subunit 15
VKSGLVDRPDVSQYRLTAHLALAVAIYGLQIWTAYSLLVPHVTAPVGAALRRSAYVLLVLIVATILAGGFVAGLDAGFAYNTFPLMAGRWVPEDFLALAPWYRNFFDNVAAVQFNHRLLAIVTGLSGILIWVGISRRVDTRRARMVVHGFLLALLGQIALGIATLVWVVPLPIAATHQAGALVLFTFALLLVYECRGRVPVER